MFDARLRPWKARVFEPVAARVPRIPPSALTAAGLALGLAAALAVASHAPWAGLALWLSSRAVDGLDGEVARLTERQSAVGGYLDILADFLVYAALPLALAWQSGTTPAWIAAAVLLGSFYLNTASWMFLSAVLGARPHRPRPGTTIEIPPGLVEGAETIVCFTAMLLVPGMFAELALAMAGLVFLTAGQRVAWAVRSL